MDGLTDNQAMQRFIAAVLAERQIQDAIWGGAEHDSTHVSMDWIDLIDERVQKLRAPFPVDPVVRLARYRRLMIEIAALAQAAYEYVDFA